MRLTLNSFDDELVTLDADPAWQLQDMMMSLPLQFPETGGSVRVFYGTTELSGQRTLEDIGAGCGGVLTIVRSKLSLILTASDDRSAKIWSAASGECVQTLTGHNDALNSAVFSPHG